MQDHQEEWLELCAQASVEQNPQKLFQLVRRINELLEAKEKRLQVNTIQSASKGNGVFQIAYDETLLVAREQLLKNRGYEVGSALGNDDAKRLLDKRQPYSLFIVGHAAPTETREEIVRWLKAKFPDTKILALNPPDNMQLARADYNLILSASEEWLSTVANATP